MKRYKVLYFSQSDVGKLEQALNDANAEGYEFKAMHLDQSYRTLVIMELPLVNPEAPRPRGRPRKIEPLVE